MTLDVCDGISIQLIAVIKDGSSLSVLSQMTPGNECIHEVTISLFLVIKAPSSHNYSLLVASACLQGSMGGRKLQQSAGFCAA